ncbi:hypothetical protein CSOJ01_14290 [Colletotrichum sojae]|uniref:Uncharacterized protein n=1 Tax=Colletotrichum sojae TaxID=2175907 RepID=A0A8H6IQ63_9PEZI|nr:hypothetical protein CSOJ01_14290 [Colletotrichum sojae]
MSSTEKTRFDIIYSPLDITEHTVLPQSNEFSERHDFWNNMFKFTSPECPESLLLVWPIFGPLTDIAVLDSTAATGKAFENRQPFVTDNPDGSRTFHPVASLPATYPLLSRITTTPDILDKFRGVSERMTEVHDMDWDHIYEAEPAGITKFYCRDEECKNQPYLYMTKEPELSIDAREKPYVTLGEVVCAIHEWLLSLQEEILVGQTAVYNDDVWGCQDPMLPRDTKFWVTGIWRMDVVRQAVSEPDGHMPWNPITGRGCTETEEEWGSAWRWRGRGARS